MPADVRAVRDHYAVFGDAYEAAWGPSFHFAVFSTDAQLRAEAIRATERMVAAEGGFGAGMRLLDVGCGRGGPALEIAGATGARVTGIDLLERNVAFARERAAVRSMSGRTSFAQADALALPFADATFDGVYAFESGCHAPDKPRYYRECARVLRPGGAFVGIDWLVHDGLTSAERERWIGPVCREFACPELVSAAELRALLAGSGLVEAEVGDLAARGRVTPNWAPLDAAAIDRIRRSADPATLERLVRGSGALVQAQRHGAFMVGLWRARKPCVDGRG